MGFNTDKTKKTKDMYGFLWKSSKSNDINDNLHFENMQRVITEPIVKNGIGVELGSGCGWDTYFMAKNNPLTKVISLDVSDGVYKTKQLTSGLSKVGTIKGSVLNLPFKDGSFDFAYSFGVLHHISNPEYGLREINRIIKKDAPTFLYLYEDRLENWIKYLAIKIVNIFRSITTKMPPRILYIACFLLLPFIVFLFSYPAKILKKFKATRLLAGEIPFNFGTHLFSVVDDLYDRFGAPIELRFNRKEIHDLFIKCNFYNICITRLKDAAGWVTWGYKR